MATDLNLDGLCIPLPAVWYHNASGACTSAGGFVYLAISQAKFVYVPPKVDGVVSRIQCFHASNLIQAIDCDPDCSHGLKVITMDYDHVLCHWDIELGMITASCRAHNPNYTRSGKRRPNGGAAAGGRAKGAERSGAMCVLRDGGRVLSNVGTQFVLWCTLSNTYSQFQVDKMFERDEITLLKASPYDDNLVAAGTGRGLVLVVDIVAKKIVHKMRGHEKRITSLDWMELPVVGGSVASPTPTCTPSRPKLQATHASPFTAAAAAQEAALRGNLVPIVESDDVFDIYDFDDCADRFGVLAKPTFGPSEREAETERLRMLSVEEKAVGNDHFDFVEACQSLKEDIVGTKPVKQSASVDSESSLSSEFEKLDMAEKEKSGSGDDADGGVQVKNVTAEGFIVVQDVSKNDRKAEVVGEETVTSADAAAAPKETLAAKRCVYLASGSQESFVWIWNTRTGGSLSKMDLKRASKHAAIPQTNTSICWMDERTMVVNTPNGDLVLYDLQMTEKKLLVKQNNELFSQRSVTGLYKCTVAPGAPLIWSKSVGNELVCTTCEERPKVVQHFCTAVIPQMAIRESPHDPNIIAMAGNGRRINLLHLSSLRRDNIRITACTSRMQAKVLYLAWHPERPDQIAFSTEEGRVGIYDTNKPSNMPQIVKPFCSSPIYQIAWAKVRSGTPADETAEAADADHWILFVCTKGSLVYVPEIAASRHSGNELQAVQVLEEADITAVGASEAFLAFGSHDGLLLVYRPFVRQNILTTKQFSRRLGNRYISECAFCPLKPNRLAVATSDKGIHVFDCDTAQGAEPLSAMELLGHAGVTMVKWSAESHRRLVSTGFDGQIRVWEDGECVALVQTTSIVNSALFLPSDENYVMAVSLLDMVRVYDMRLHRTGVAKAEMVSKMARTPVANSHKFASIVQTDPRVLSAQEKKNNRRRARGGRGGRGQGAAGGAGGSDAALAAAGGVQELASPEQPISRQQQLAQHVVREIVDDEDSDVGIISEALHRSRNSSESLGCGTMADARSECDASDGRQSFNYSTICHLSNKELNKDALKLLNDLIAEVPPEPLTLNQKVFGTRAQVNEMLQAELESHRESQTDSVAHVLIPQLCDQLEQQICTAITTNSLTERHLAMAPGISYQFWQKCCAAYARQLLTRGAPLPALPYFLACRDTAKAIEELCRSHLYREAWIVAKLHRESSDSIFTTIGEQWTSHLVSVGHLEGAAFVSAAIGDRTHAATLLQTRRNQTPEMEELIKILLLTSTH